ncbi:uncharacterized protein N7525_000405 [Penicillium rubens]|uniref:uncharacterized protein n=1 Tax=Penicillium rubens TaxID=1108849 RepID=UPI002A5A16A9|nr:uncharacterized protein N7525_000405 [Penicillium rubens]KAJ5842664.1 hypothetical protein N7525_000405 [Penicillium rubens]KAJ5846763.1 hypothetical protein N7534_010432 [Penicillium rubens]
MSSPSISSALLVAAIVIRKGELPTPSPLFFAWTVTLGISFVAFLSVLFFFQLLSLLFSGSSSASGALNKHGENTPGASLHWTTHLYGVAAIVWGLHSLIMQQATYWFNIAKREEEKRGKAAKAREDSLQISRQRTQFGQEDRL